MVKEGCRECRCLLEAISRDDIFFLLFNKPISFHPATVLGGLPQR